MDFRIMSDSSCDISAEQETAYDIRLVPYYVSFDGETKRGRLRLVAQKYV